jgi:hypothetical protein
MLGAVLAIVVAVGLAAAAMSVSPRPGAGIPTQSQESSTTSIQGASSVLIVQLTDPPIVPVGTTSLNLTYTAIDLLVTEPSTSTITSTITGTTTTITSTMTNQKGQVNSQVVSITPKTSPATVDLLKLQNISQTLALANLPSGSTIYSVSFVVSSISIDINGVISPVTLATDGSTLLVTLTHPAVLEGTNAVLLDLTPTVISTPTGYQMIPSATGIIRPQSEISGQDQQVGYEHQLSNQDHQDLSQATGQVTANLLALSVSGSTTTITVQVSNTGNSPVQMVAIALHGNFTAQSCVTTTTSSQQDNHGDSGHQHGCENPNEVVFIPSVTAVSSTTSTSSSTSSTSSSSTTTSTTTASCTPGQLTLVNSGDMGSNNNNQGNDNSHLVLAPGQCITLTFAGTISFGQSGNVLVPSTLAGQTYTVHVIASNSAEMKLSCTLPVSKTSCTVVSNQNGDN